MVEKRRLKEIIEYLLIAIAVISSILSFLIFPSLVVFRFLLSRPN